MMYCSFVDFALYAFRDIQQVDNSQQSRVELISKLRRDSSWKDVKLAFTYNLWHLRCMKAYFTMTAHWIEIRGGALTTECMPHHRILDALPV